MEILGYKYNSKEEAQAVVNQLNNYWELPKPNGESEFTISMFDTYGGGYWCYANKRWYAPVLGEPYIFEVPDPPTTI